MEGLVRDVGRERWRCIMKVRIPGKPVHYFLRNNGNLSEEHHRAIHKGKSNESEMLKVRRYGRSEC